MKRYSDKASAEAIIRMIKSGELTGNTAYRALVQIAEEWSGTSTGRDAEDLIDNEFSEYKYAN